jgi:hypothetical protein
VKVVHRGRGKGRRTVICKDLELSRPTILRHLKRRWGIEVMFKLLKEQFGVGDCRCRGPQSLARWVELVLLAYVLAGLTRWGKQLRGEEPRWGAVRQSWGWTLIQTVEGGAGVARYSRAVASLGLPVPLSNLRPQVRAGGHLDSVKDL